MNKLFMIALIGIVATVSAQGSGSRYEGGEGGKGRGAEHGHGGKGMGEGGMKGMGEGGMKGMGEGGMKGMGSGKGEGGMKGMGGEKGGKGHEHGGSGEKGGKGHEHGFLSAGMASSKTVSAAGYATMAVGVAAVAGVAAITIRRRRTAGYTELAADESIPSHDGTPLIA